MHMVVRLRWVWLAMAAGMLLAATVGGVLLRGQGQTVEQPAEDKAEYIKWVDFNVSYEALDRALSLDIAANKAGTPISWIDLLAYAAAKNGNNFKGFRLGLLDETAAKLQNGTPIEELTENMKYFSYYKEAFTAVLGGMVGDFAVEVPLEGGSTEWQQRYGLRAFSPIAKNYPYVDFDDFGASRSYGFRRKHLGHDLMGQVGTPVIAVEGGTVEALGWNQYGGWRIGIRSHDKKRYYYYAHLRRNYPYALGLEVGSEVQAGDVIGYLGRTGYSATENVNNIDDPHLHFGMQLIFDESQKEGNNEIWIDVYPIVRLLSRHRSEVVKDLATKNYSRVYGFKEHLP